MNIEKYNKQTEFLKSLRLIPTGFGNIWTNGKYIATIDFYEDKIQITNLKINE